MANQLNVKVVVSAVDQASAVLKRLGSNIDSSSSKVAKNASNFQQFGASVKTGLTTALTGATKFGLAAGAVVAAIGGIVAAASPFISASNQMENALLGLASVAGAMGVPMNQAQDAAKALASDGLMTITESAEGLKNLLATGFSLPEAINLMNAFKDSAAFNRQGMLGFGEAVVGATQGIKNQNSIMVDNAGITKNLSNIIEEAGGSVNDLGKVTSDTATRQRLYNGLVREASIFQGDAARMSETFSGQLARTSSVAFQLKAAIGDGLKPAAMLLADVFGGMLTSALSFVQKHMGSIQGATIALTGTLITAVNLIVGIVRVIAGAFMSLVTFSWAPLENAFAKSAAAVVTSSYNMNRRLEDAATKAAQKNVTSHRTGLGRQQDAQRDHTSKQAREMEKETEKFQEEMEKREKRFKEQLADLIYAHIDKRDSLRKDLEEENTDFSDRMDERNKDFKERMDEMKGDHEEKKAEIEAQIAEELAKGQEADLAQVESLKQRLVAEDEEYAKQKAKEEQRKAEEDEKIKKEHEKRLAEIQERLTKEEEILKTHQADVDAVKEKAREDDITRLKRQYEEEKQEATKEHERRMKEKMDQGELQGGAYGGGLEAGLAGPLASIEETLKTSGEQAGKNFGDALVTQIKQAGRDMVKSFVEGVVEKAKSFAINAARTGADIGLFGPVVSVASNAARLLGFDTGGTVPGNPNEAVPIIAHGQERVVPSARLSSNSGGGAGSIQFNVNIGLYAGSETEKRNIARDLYGALVQVAKSQNKTVSEFMNDVRR